MPIGSVGYGLAAAGFAVLALLMLTSWRGRLQGGLLVVAAALTAAWAALAAITPGHESQWNIVTLLEVARNVAWLVFLSRLTPAGQGLDGRPRQLAALAPAAFVLICGLAAVVVARSPDNLAVLIQALIVTGLVTAIAGLVLLEQAFRAMRVGPRRQLLPLIVGVGGILAYDLFLYSHALLFLALHAELWAARGFANLLAIPFLLLAARRNPDWSINVFVSRHVVFYTTSLMAIGAYLLVMAIAGYGLRIAGGEWGFVLQVIFFFGALAVLAWLLFLPNARASLRVFVAKHFFSNKYDYRDEWLNLTRRLGEGDDSEPVPARGLRALTALVGADAGVLWVPAGDNEADGFRRGPVVGGVPVGPETLSADAPLVAFLAERRWTVNVPEAMLKPESHPGLAVPGWFREIHGAALIVPLLNRDRLLGIAALLGPTRVGRLSYEDIDLLRVAGMQVAAVLAQAEADRLLTESRQFEAFNRFAAFIMHDLKNIIAQQSLVVRNAAKYRDDPAFIDDALDTVANSVERMQRLLEQLRRGQGEPVVERVDLRRLVLEIVSRHAERQPIPTAHLPAARLRLRVDRERFSAVLGHLLSNAQDATPADGAVTVEAELERDGALVLAVADTGSGMDEAFIRERLFRPFDSTKGSKGMGIGAYQARQFVQALAGEVSVTSMPGAGTRFELRFPPAIVEQEQEQETEGPAAAPDTERLAPAAAHAIERGERSIVG